MGRRYIGPRVLPGLFVEGGGPFHLTITAADRQSS